MSLKTTLLAAAAAVSLAGAALAGDITVRDPYARTSMMMAETGAAFMLIDNTGAEDDRLVGVRSEVAERTELHTHKQDDQGVMRMVHVEEGFDLPAGGTLEMKRGGHHVMFLGLREPLEQGDTVHLTLQFEKAGDVEVEVPVDLDRQPVHGGAAGQGMQHGMNQGKGMTPGQNINKMGTAD